MVIVNLERWQFVASKWFGGALKLGGISKIQLIKVEISFGDERPVENC